MSTYQVTFLPDNVTTAVCGGASLLHAARAAGVDLNSPCGGKGTCGKCAVRIGESSYTDALACRTEVHCDLTVEIPAEARMKKQKVLLSEKQLDEDGLWRRYKMDPIAGKYHLTLPAPDLADSMNDLDRLLKALKKEHGIEAAGISLNCLREFPEAVREGGFEVTVTVVESGGRCEIIGVTPGLDEKPAYGAAVDIGTTTVVCAICDLKTGKVIDREGSYNRQASFGADVITRIIHADENKEGLSELKEAAVSTINSLIEALTERNGLDRGDIVSMVCGGNTVMTHLFFGVTPKYLRLEPYIPATVSFPQVKAADIGIDIHRDAPVLAIPSVASYVGGDITAGVFAIMPGGSEEINLFIDVGTNGELVLGNCEWLVTCSCSAGPAFEGSGVSSGMRAMDGAVDRIEIDRESLRADCGVIGDTKPVGVCGSGLICALSEMLAAGVIDRAGKIRTDKGNDCIRVRDEAEYLLIQSEESGTGSDITITESDVKNLLRAKAAVFAGIRTMLAQVHMDVSDIANVYIAGGFGSNINITDAVQIGMLPDLPEEKYEYVGNSCIKGAILGLLSKEALAAMDGLAGRMTYIELSIGNQFMEEFISALFIPHTDLGLFPSLQQAGQKQGKE